MAKRILVPCDSRANLTRCISICEAIQAHPQLELQLVIFGPLANSWQFYLPAHLQPTAILDHTTPTADTLLSISHTYSDIINSLVKCFTALHPDIVIALTDRYETLAVATACLLLNLPIAHIQGGELTGTIDEHIRHAVTKLSHLHFVATGEAAEVVRSLGEDNENIYNVGCPATDLLLRNAESISRNDMGIRGPYILVLFHPVYTEYQQAYQQMIDVLTGVEEAWDGQLIVIGPNHDAGNYSIWQAIKDFGIRAASDVPFDDYVRLMANAEVFVTNSSSGIREACYFGTPVVDVGSRQQARMPRGRSVVAVQPSSRQIGLAVQEQLKIGRNGYSAEFLYGDGKAGEYIARILADIEVPGVQKRLNRDA